MARYKHIDLSPRLLAVNLEAQLVPGTFAHGLHHLIDALDLSAFDVYFRNDANGAPAHAPAMLLEAVLLAYSPGVVSSRAIERACRDNALLIALTGEASPHFMTIADFISRSRDAIASVFAQVPVILGKEGLVGRDTIRGGYSAIKFRAPASACKGCALRANCLRKPEATKPRQVAVLTRKPNVALTQATHKLATHTQAMRERIDSEEGRRQYGRRFGIVEPVFANLRHNKRLNRFTLRGQRKVDGQWKLFALVHNIEKWANLHQAA